MDEYVIKAKADLAGACCEALGLDHRRVNRLTLTFEPGGTVVAEVLMEPSVREVQSAKFASELTRWTLVPKEGG